MCDVCDVWDVCEVCDVCDVCDVISKVRLDEICRGIFDKTYFLFISKF